MEVSDQLHALAALPLGKEPMVPTGQETGWAPEAVWTQWKKKNSQPLWGIKSLNPNHPAHSQLLY